MNAEPSFLYPTHEALIDAGSIGDMALTEQVAEIQAVYRGDSRPWIIGFSGGKDSTAVLSLVYTALLRLQTQDRHKPVYVVSSDTLVETPVVVDLVQHVLKVINTQAKRDRLDISAHTVYPQMDQTFWVNLLGRGYPAPKQSFRWCTERMKIDPVTDFITRKAALFGEVVVVLGSRSQESVSRAQVIAKHKIGDLGLGRHTSIPNAYTFMPIVSWSADDVWEYLMGAPCPWGGNNQQLFDLYKGSNQGECPLVIDKSTPSCGNSRFGCWTCTVVTEDRALHGLIESGDDWMRPLLAFRDKLYNSNEPENTKVYRNIKRRSGRITYRRARGENPKDQEIREVRGPYLMKWRQAWLKELLEIQKSINEAGQDFSFIREEELQAIRQEWLRDPNEPDILDSLPRIYREVYGEQIEWTENDAGAFTAPDAVLLQRLAERHDLEPEMIMKLLEVELSVSGLGRRKGVMRKLESVIEQDWDIEEAMGYRNQEYNAAMTWRDEINDLQTAIDAASAAVRAMDEGSQP
ncbi:MAG: DNA phosphorothioation system sulfurtransferase DndC [Candidatus Thiodiazotropha endolucinida]|nr:DNA phosphorothioation system sulfurtransferase DndC [Candidatus Thiodiazotropha taylori]MCW4315296.1 DNA phosphorothioation system sulfurtransferase DndC [Candidatus Thiodiazotropha taylori]